MPHVPGRARQAPAASWATRPRDVGRHRQAHRAGQREGPVHLAHRHDAGDEVDGVRLAPRSPASVRYAAGGASDRDLGHGRARAAGLVRGPARGPSATAAAARIASSRAGSPGRASRASGRSVPSRPRSLRPHEHHRVGGVDQRGGDGPSPGTSRASWARPVGSSRPVTAPPGSRKSSAIRAPVPGTPSSTKSPRTAAWLDSTGTRAWISFRVLVLWIRTTVAGSRAGTSPSSMAKGPIADEMLPQLPR